MLSLENVIVTVQDDLINVPDAFGDSVSSVSFNQGFHCTVFRYVSLPLFSPLHSYLSFPSTILILSSLLCIRDRTCAGPNITLHYPGTHDLAYIGFNDKMSSYHCELGQ